MDPSTRLSRTTDWLRSWSDLSFLLVLAYLAALVSILSYTLLNGGQGTPSALEVGLIAISITAAFLLSMDMLGSGRAE